MTYLDATSASATNGHFGLLRLRLGVLLPLLVFAFPMLVWPLTFSAFRAGTGTGTLLSNIDASESNVINVAYFLAVGAAFALGVAFRREFWKRVPLNAPTLAIFAYLLIAGLSVSWAIEPSISFRRYFQQVIIILGVLLAGHAERDPARFINSMCTMMLAIVGINLLWLGVKAPSPLGVEGIYPHKNTLGAALIVALPFLIYAAILKRGRLRLTFGAGVLGAIGLLMLSQSKTSIGLAVIAPSLALVTIYGFKIVRIPAFAFVAITATSIFGIGGIIVILNGITWPDVSLLLFDDPTFTGRTFIWDFVGRQAEERPLLGYGFNSFWAVGYNSPSVRSAPGFIVSLLQAHNGYWDIRLETGLVGLCLLLIILTVSISQACEASKVNQALGWLALTLIYTAIMHNGLESSFFRGFNLMWMAVLVAIYISSQRKKILPPTSRENAQSKIVCLRTERSFPTKHPNTGLSRPSF